MSDTLLKETLRLCRVVGPATNGISDAILTETLRIRRAARLGKLPDPPLKGPKLEVEQILLTLPFVIKSDGWGNQEEDFHFQGPNKIKCKKSLRPKFRKVYKKTQRNRRWFHNAVELDKERKTCLGTLNYLPVEIRSQLWLLMLDSDQCYRQSPRNRRQLNCGQKEPDWDGRPSFFEDILGNHVFGNLRTASYTIDREIRFLALNLHSFQFKCAEEANHWSEDRTEGELAAIRQISITPFACYHHNQYHDQCRPAEWMKALAWLTPLRVWWHEEPSRATLTIDVTKMMKEDHLKQALAFVDVLSKRYARAMCTTKIQIDLLEEMPIKRDDSAIPMRKVFQDLLNEIEPLSESTIGFLRDQLKRQRLSIISTDEAQVKNTMSPEEIIQWASSYDIAVNILASPESKLYRRQSFYRTYMPPAVLSALKSYRANEWALRKSWKKAQVAYITYKMSRMGKLEPDLLRESGVAIGRIRAESMRFGRFVKAELLRFGRLVFISCLRWIVEKFP